jgi:hypothetical protein
MRWPHNLGLEKIVTDLSDQVLSPGMRLVAIDSTVVSVFGDKLQGAERGYNPHKPGRDSYHPLLAVDVGARSVLDGYLRPGSCASGHGLDDFVRKLIAESRHPVDQTVFRLDKGLICGDVLDTLEDKRAGYVGKVKLTANVLGKISKIKKWRAVGNGHFAATTIRTQNFWANDVLFITGLIAYNLLNCIRRLALPKALRTARIKRLGLLLLRLPAKPVYRSRQLWLRIDRDYPSRFIFYKARAALR